MDFALRHATAARSSRWPAADTGAALAEVQRGAGLVARVAQLELHAKHEEVSAEVLRLRSAAALAERHRTAALECWERIGSTLPAELAEVFWRHPGGRAFAAGPAAGGPHGSRAEAARGEPAPGARRSTRRRRCRLAMDAAIELTGAERVRDSRVAVAGTGRPREGQARGRCRAEPRSRARRQEPAQVQPRIAKRVVERGEAVLTVDALADERFSRERVRARPAALVDRVRADPRATARCSAPSTSTTRFQRGKFAEGDADLLWRVRGPDRGRAAQRQADGRARRRTRALEEEQRRVAELMRSQADQIERLSHELERTRADARRDFPEIAGGARRCAWCSRSASASRRATTVTVTGESGTGKELVARRDPRGRPRRGRGRSWRSTAPRWPEAPLESSSSATWKARSPARSAIDGGLFVSAGGVTLFLDGSGGAARRAGEAAPRAPGALDLPGRARPERLGVVDVRVVCATNRSAGGGRPGALSGGSRHWPRHRDPLAAAARPAGRHPGDRAGDRREASRRARAARRSGSRGALRRLSSYGWPGNVRQLENVLSRACVLLSPGPEIGAADIQLAWWRRPRRGAVARRAPGRRGGRSAPRSSSPAGNVSEVSRSLDPEDDAVPEARAIRVCGRE